MGKYSQFYHTTSYFHPCNLLSLLYQNPNHITQHLQQTPHSVVMNRKSDSIRSRSNPYPEPKPHRTQVTVHDPKFGIDVSIQLNNVPDTHDQGTNQPPSIYSSHIPSFLPQIYLFDTIQCTPAHTRWG